MSEPATPDTPPSTYSVSTHRVGWVATTYSIVLRGRSHTEISGLSWLGASRDISFPAQLSRSRSIDPQPIPTVANNCQQRSSPARSKAIADPVDHEPRRRVALQMVLHQEPQLATALQLGQPQPAIGEQIAAQIVRQDADRLVRLQQRVDDADIVGDATRALLQPANFQELHFGYSSERIRIAADDRVGDRFARRLDEIKPELTELRNREIALLRLA